MLIVKSVLTFLLQRGIFSRKGEMESKVLFLFEIAIFVWSRAKLLSIGPACPA